MKIINEFLSYIEKCDEPLSSESFIIKGKENTYIYDVGSSKEAVTYINSLNNSIIILSHFHKDHINNINEVKFSKLYVGSYTNKYLKYGEIINETIYINDGIKLEIAPIPSTHAKGCIYLNINNEYTLLGDSIYPKVMDGKSVYNTSLLIELIKALEKIDTIYFILSHEGQNKYFKNDIIKKLKENLNKRTKEPYIYI